MRHPDQGQARLRDHAIHGVQNALAMCGVEALAWFVQDEQPRPFHHGAGEHHQSLAAQGHFSQRPPGQSGSTEGPKPGFRAGPLA